MAPTQRKKGPRSESSASKSSVAHLEPPRPFRSAPPSLAPLLDTLDRRRVYLAHVDTKPASFKRQVFAVPVLMNLAVAALFVWRLLAVAPWYWHLVASALRDTSSDGGGTPIDLATATWSALGWLVIRRASTFMLDFVLFVFVWPWPLEFAFGVRGSGGCPAAWRWGVGFRDAELCLRCSRREWDRDGRLVADALGQLDVAAARAVGKKRERPRGEDAAYQAGGEESNSDASSNALLRRVGAAMDSTRLRDKTAYLLMDGDWDLAWAAMVRATRLVDDKAVALDDLQGVVLLHDESHGGWLSVVLGMDGLGGGGGDGGVGGGGGSGGGGVSAKDEERRRQVFAFRDALTAVGKEDLFFRWIEVIQFETSRPEGFTDERQVTVAQQIRDLFQSNGIDFDQFWKEAVGSDAADGLLSEGVAGG